MEDKMNNTELTKKYDALSYDADVLRMRISEVKEQIGEREVVVPIGSVEAIGFKPSLTEEIDDLKETISMLFDYLNIVIQEKTTEKRIVKSNSKTKNK